MNALDDFLGNIRQSLPIHISLGHQIGRDRFNLARFPDVSRQCTVLLRLVFPQRCKSSSATSFKIQPSRFTRKLSELTEDGEHCSGVELLRLFPG